MKRAAIYALILSMLAVPMFAQNPSVTKARCVSLEHISGGWRMAIDCDQGKGTITLTDQMQYHGDGIFAGWSQGDLSSSYQSLLPKVDAQSEVMQLG